MKKSYLFEAAIALLLVALAGALYLAVASTPVPAGGWELPAEGPVDYMTTGSDGTLYTFVDDTVYALTGNGSLKWKQELPAGWTFTYNVSDPASLYSLWPGDIPERGEPRNTSYITSRFVAAAEGNGTLYAYAIGEPANADFRLTGWNGNLSIGNVSSKVIALSPEGRVEWEYDFSRVVFRQLPRPELPAIMQVSPLFSGDIVDIRAQGGKVYVYHDFAEDILSADGRLLFTIGNLSRPANIGGDGQIFTVRGVKPGTSEGDPWSRAADVALAWDAYRDPSKYIDSYDSSGRLAWSQYLDYSAAERWSSSTPSLKKTYLPLFSGNLLVVPVEGGLVALNTSGQVQWHAAPSGYASHTWLSLFSPMDSTGNIYLKAPASTDGTTECLYVFNSTGAQVAGPWYISVTGQNETAPFPVSGNDGVFYLVSGSPRLSQQLLDQRAAAGRVEVKITAYDLKNNTELWTFSLPENDFTTVTLDGAHLPSSLKEYGAYQDWYRGVTQAGNSSQSRATQAWEILVSPARNTTYLSCYYARYDRPIGSDRFKCTYASALYELDDHGRLLGDYPVNGTVRRLITDNQSFYYATDEGRIGGGSLGLATAGLVLAAFSYLFLKFFALGSVSRARKILDRNDNRNLVLRYVADHPGATALDIVRDLNMNRGTVRYHLFILALNHRLVACGDDKYQRYFANNGQYSEVERSLFSLLRREPVRRMLGVLLEKPGITSMELSGELGISGTAVHRHASLLVEKGVVERAFTGDQRYSYRITSAYLSQVREYLGRQSP